MATPLHYYAIAPAGESQGSVTNPVVPAGTIFVSVPVGGPDDKALDGNGDITYNGKQYAVFMGPFNSLAALKAAKPPNGIAAIGGLIGSAAGAVIALETAPSTVPQGAGSGAAAGTAAGNAVQGWEQALGGFFQALSEANTWIRVAKVAIGGLLLIVGVAKLAGVNSGTVGKAVALAPLL